MWGLNTAHPRPNPSSYAKEHHEPLHQHRLAVREEDDSDDGAVLEEERKTAAVVLLFWSKSHMVNRFNGVLRAHLDGGCQ